MWIEPFSLSLTAPLGTAAGKIHERRGFLVGLQRDGHCGIGEATPLAGWTESYEACERALTAAARDGTPPDPAETPAAAHAVDLAELVVAARQHDHSVAAELRRTVYRSDQSLPEAIPVNATIGDAPVDETVLAARNATETGFEWLKLKVGAREPAVDLDRVRAVSTAVGADVRLRLDANGAWDRPTGTWMVDRLAELDIDYLEQPVAAGDLDGLAALRAQGVDIAVDESLTEFSLAELIETGAADVVVIKPMAVGGPTRAVETARRARTAGIEPVVTTTIDGVVARTAAVHVAASIPELTACGLATGSLLADDLAADPTVIVDGQARLPSGVGLCGDGFGSLWVDD